MCVQNQLVRHMKTIHYTPPHFLKGIYALVVSHSQWLKLGFLTLSLVLVDLDVSGKLRSSDSLDEDTGKEAV